MVVITIAKALLALGLCFSTPWIKVYALDRLCTGGADRKVITLQGCEQIRKVSHSHAIFLHKCLTDYSRLDEFKDKYSFSLVLVMLP